MLLKLYNPNQILHAKGKGSMELFRIHPIFHKFPLHSLENGIGCKCTKPGDFAFDIFLSLCKSWQGGFKQDYRPCCINWVTNSMKQLTSNMRSNATYLSRIQLLYHYDNAHPPLDQHLLKMRRRKNPKVNGHNHINLVV